MPDILHDLTIRGDAASVYDAISTPAGLNEWWTLTSSGEAAEGTEFVLGFGEQYQWRARITAAVPDRRLEFEMTEAEPDWIGTRVGFELESNSETTTVRFHHSGWSEDGPHCRGSSYCWAMYLRILKRFVEFGETVPYDRRLNV